MKETMFEIQGKEYQLKLDLKAIKYLNSAFEGGAYELIGKCISGDLPTFELVVRAGLFHTKQGFTPDDVEEAIYEYIEAEKLDMDGMVRIMNAVVMESFFYKKTVNKILKQDPKAKATIKLLLADETEEELTLNNVSETDGDTSDSSLVKS